MKRYYTVSLFIVFFVIFGCSPNNREIYPDINSFKRSDRFFTGYELTVNVPVWGEDIIDGFPPISSIYFNGYNIKDAYFTTGGEKEKLEIKNDITGLQEILLPKLKIDEQGVIELRFTDKSYDMFITSTAGFKRSVKLDLAFDKLLNKSDLKIIETYPLNETSSVEKISKESPKLIGDIKYGDSFFVPMTQGTYYKGKFFHPIIYEDKLPETDYKKWKWRWDTFGVYFPEKNDSMELLLYLPGLRSCKETMFGFTEAVNKGKKSVVVLSTDNPYHGERSGDPNFVCGITNPDKFTGRYNPFKIRRMILETFEENLYLLKLFLKYGCCGKKFKDVIILSHSLDASVAAMFERLGYVKAMVFLDPYYTLRYFIPENVFNFTTGFDLKKILWMVDVIDTVSPMIYSEDFADKSMLFELAENDEVVPLDSQIKFAEDIGLDCTEDMYLNSLKKCVVFKGAEHKSFFTRKVGEIMKKVLLKFINDLPD